MDRDEFHRTWANVKSVPLADINEDAMLAGFEHVKEHTKLGKQRAPLDFIETEDGNVHTQFIRWDMVEENRAAPEDKLGL